MLNAQVPLMPLSKFSVSMAVPPSPASYKRSTTCEAFGAQTLKTVFAGE